MKRLRLIIFSVITLPVLVLSQINRQMKLESIEEDQSWVNREKDKVQLEVRTQVPDLSFDGNRQVKVEQINNSVYRVTFNAGTIVLQLFAKEYEQLDLPPRNYKAGSSYVMKIKAVDYGVNLTESLFDVTFTANEDQLYVSYNDKAPLQSRKKIISYKLPKGEYSFLFQKEGFADEIQKINVDGNKQNVVSMKKGLSGTKNFLLPGVVTISSNPPNAELLIDGQKIGVTPYDGELTAGKHQLELRKPLYYPNISQFDLKEAETQDLNIQLKERFGYLNVTDQPEGTTIYLGNKKIGTAPIQKYQIQSGHYELLLTNEYYHDSTVVIQIIDGKESNITTQIRPAFGSLSITTQPEDDATVAIDGNMVGKTPYNNKKLTSGKYLIHISKPLFADVEEEIIIQDNKELNRTIILPTNYGTLTVSAPECSILLNEKGIGKDKLFTRLAPGRYTVKADRGKTYISEEKQIFIRNSESELLTFDLKPRMGAASVFVQPANANKASIYVNDELRGNAPLVLQLMIGEYTITAKANNYLDLQQQISIKENEKIRIDLQMFTYEGSLEQKRKTWTNVKWYSLVATSLAGGAAYYFNTQKNSNYDKYKTATSSADAATYRTGITKNNTYVTISLSVVAVSVIGSLTGLIGELSY